MKRQKDIVPSFEKYTLKPNSMQEEFIINLRKIIERGEEKALLISATGTGKNMHLHFAVREVGFKRVCLLFIEPSWQNRQRSLLREYLIILFQWELLEMENMNMIVTLYLLWLRH